MTMRTKIKSLDEFDEFIKSAISDRMEENIAAMKAYGLSDDEINDAMPALIEQCERAREEAVMNVIQELSDTQSERLN
jgi:hypothetical protein